ncbi:MAG: adenosine deaminase [Pseudomonadota bacterium]
MYKSLSCALIAVTVSASAAATNPLAARAADGLANTLISLVGGSGAKGVRSADEMATARHYAALVAAPHARMAELTMFMTQMPKGGDLHHHYSGAIYAEQYLDWVGKQGYCVDKSSYRIETRKEAIDAQRALPAASRSCLSAAEMLADELNYREMLQRWSSKDFYNHGAIQSPPDTQFFQTFGYFGPVSNANFNDGLQELKKRAIAENVGYIETMFKNTPFVQDADFDARVQQALADDAALNGALEAKADALAKDGAFQQRLGEYVSKIDAAGAGIDDERFTMRYQAYVVRLMAPSMVYSSLLSAFEAASRNPLVVGVNIVGAENNAVSMRDYALHMKMFRFLHARYPKVKLALHAGELALGMVPPEGLSFHIEQAIKVAGASRIGHGMDLAHESDVLGILQTMREKDIPVEINLTSNDFILGIKDQAHPVTLYRRYGVPFVISTDDAGVSRNNLSNEYVLYASRYQPDYAEIKKLSYNALRYAFLTEPERKRLSAQLDERYAKFEAAIAALERHFPAKR